MYPDYDYCDYYYKESGELNKPARLSHWPKNVLLSATSLFLLIFLLAPAASCSRKELKARPGGFEAGLQQNDVGYEIFVRSFRDSDGDRIGDFQGIIEKLDYLEKLGVSILWLMPINKCNSYHGYDVTDYYKVNRKLGTMEDFEELLQKAHKRGIKIIMDLVLNHSSSDHPWFLKSCNDQGDYRDWYVWRSSRPTGNWISRYTPFPWYYFEGSYYYGYFTPGMPDLNYEHEAVRREAKKLAGYWIRKGVAGFRLDAARHLIETGPGPEGQNNTPETLAYWKEFSAHIKKVNPGAFIVGENWDTLENIDKYYMDGRGMDMSFDFSLGEALLDACNQQNAAPIRDFISAERNSPWPFYCTFWRNHDMERYMGELDAREHKYAYARLGMALLLTLPGTPFLYYGEEIGMDNNKSLRGDRAARTPMQWNDEKTAGFSEKSGHLQLGSHADPENVAAQQKDPDSLLHTIRQLIHLRRQTKPLHSGSVELVQTTNEAVLAYWRGSKSDIASQKRVLVAVNLGAKEAALSISGREAGTKADRKPLVRQGNVKLQNIKEEGQSSQGLVIALPPRSFTVLQ